MRLCKKCGAPAHEKSHDLLCLEHLREYKTQKAATYATLDPERIKKNRRNGMKAWRDRNPAEVVTKRQTFYDANKVRINADRRKKRDKPKQPAMSADERNTKKREQYADNKSYYAEKNRRWHQDNPVKHRQTVRLRKLRLADLGAFEQSEWEWLVAECDGRCLKCGETKPLTVDHIIPLSKDGWNTLDNIQPLCASCNSSKRVRLIDYRPLHIRLAVWNFVKYGRRLKLA